MAEQGSAGASIRARVRAEMVEEIKAAARERMATDGASLSLRAVARDLGMVSSAVYRYFASRDELLTALILDAYNAMGETAEAADAAVRKRADYLGRFLAVARALRDWAVAHPHEYALIYGSPVPGYAAPRDTVEPSIRPVLVLGSVLGEATAAGRLADRGSAPVPRVLRADIRQVRDYVAPAVDEAVMTRALIAWTELFGAISFELFGRFNNTIDDLEAWFDHQARAMAEYVGLVSGR